MGKNKLIPTENMERRKYTMKRIFAMILVTALLLSGCGTLVPAKSTVPTTQDTPAATKPAAPADQQTQPAETAATEAPAATESATEGA